MEFHLSLLNEQGNQAVTFRKGENFSFRFEMENIRKDDKRQYIAHIHIVSNTQPDINV